MICKEPIPRFKSSREDMMKDKIVIYTTIPGRLIVRHKRNTSYIITTGEWDCIKIQQEVSYFEPATFSSNTFDIPYNQYAALLIDINQTFYGNQEWVFVNLDDPIYDVIAFETKAVPVPIAYATTSTLPNYIKLSLPSYHMVWPKSIQCAELNKSLSKWSE